MEEGLDSQAKMQPPGEWKLHQTRNISLCPPACNAGDVGLLSGSGRPPGEGHGSPLQYSCLGNPMDRGAWRARVHGVARSQTRLSD